MVKILMLTFSGSEKHIIDKIITALADEQAMEHIYVPAEPELTFQRLKILPRRRQIFLDGNEVEVTTREFDVLYYLARHGGQVFTIRQLYEGITREEYIDTYHSLESIIYRLRKKLGKDVIVNVRGYGYKFNWK